MPPLLQRDDSVVTADAIPTVQIQDGYVWAQAMIGSTVYAVGKFDNARAPLAAPGTQLTPRSNILAYDINSGQLLPFSPTVNGVVKSVAASPDGSRIYIGGSFTKVNGQTRYTFAALDAATGELVPGFSPSVGGSGVYAIAVDGSTVYVGGLFSQANGTARVNLAAFSASNGALLQWAPQTDLQVDAMVMDPQGQKVIVGGRFSQVNGNTQMRGTAALDKLTGELDTAWAVPQTVVNGAGSGSNAGKAGIFGLAADDEAVYGTGWVFADKATGNLEGTFAAEAGSGDIRWIADCLGDHYGVYSTGSTVYATSHTHACSTMGLAPEQSPRTHRFLEAFTTDARGVLGYQPATGSTYKNWEGTPAPSAYAWYPDMATGITTGLGQAGLSITGAGDLISVAGEFRAVNNLQFEGIVRFSTSPPGGAKDRPRLNGSAWTLDADSFVPGRVRVGFAANWDRDDMNLTYELRRSGVSTPVATVTTASTWWEQPDLILEDTTAQPGSEQTYTVVAKDEDGNTASSQSVTVTVADGETSDYVHTVLADSAQLYYPLGDTTHDWAGAYSANFGGGVVASTDGIEGASTGSSVFNGASNGRVSSGRAAVSHEFSTELWFRTTTGRGGKLIGYGSAATGDSSSYDRHVYMRNDGRLVFGVYPGSTRVIQSDLDYNDGQWHHVVATQSAEGIHLYVDGALVASDASVTSAQSYSGYWRVGGDNINGWPSAPSSKYFNGSIDEVAVYDYALAAAQVRNHHAVGLGFEAPSAVFDVTTESDVVGFDASESSAAGSATLEEYEWDFGDDSATGSGRTATHSYAANGTYTVTLTLTDSNGRTATAQQVITVLGPNELPQADFVVDQSGLTTTVDASSSTDADGELVEYSWDWGDGSPVETGKVASHAYAEAGTYSVTLVVTDDRGGEATLSQEIVATHADPVAEFSVSSAGLAITTDATASSASDGATIEYDWDWGDGTSHGSGVSAQHTYVAEGEYTIVLTVTDSLGATRTVSQAVAITAQVFAVSDSFERTVSNGWGAADSGETWAVSGGSSADLSVTAGTGIVDVAPGGTREVTALSTALLDSASTITYTLDSGPSRGALYVGIGARKDGQNGYRGAVWHRADGSVWAVIQRNGGAVAVQPLSGVTWSAGNTFHLVTEVTGPAPASIRMKVWADGTAEPSNWQLETTDSTSELQKPGAVSVYAYRSGSGTGANSISFDNLTVQDLAETSETNTQPVASFTHSVDALTVTVDGSASSDAEGAIASYAWEFGDGATASGATASHEYASAGSYTVTLTVTDEAGKTHSHAQDITAVAVEPDPQPGDQAPVASFTHSVDALTVTVDGSASSDAEGAIASYAWEFGDGATASGATASHEYASAGSYTVTLTVTDEAGKAHSVAQDITLADPQVEPDPVEDGLLAGDGFARAVVSGWGTADIGGAWSVTGGGQTALSVVGEGGNMALAVGSTRHATLSDMPIGDAVVETEFSVSPGAETGGSYISVLARSSAAGQYLIRAWMRPDGAIWLVVSRSGTLLGVKPLSGLSVAADTTYTLKASVTGSSDVDIDAKLWVTGAAEPSAWQLSVTDDSGQLAAPGATGLSGYRMGNSTEPMNVVFTSFWVTSPE